MRRIRRRKESRYSGNSGMTLLETVMGMALLTLLLLSFLTVLLAGARSLSWRYGRERSVRRLFEQSQRGEGALTGERLELLFTLEEGASDEEGNAPAERAPAAEIFEEREVLWPLGERTDRLTYYEHES